MYSQASARMLRSTLVEPVGRRGGNLTAWSCRVAAALRKRLDAGEFAASALPEGLAGRHELTPTTVCAVGPGDSPTVPSQVFVGAVAVAAAKRMRSLSAASGTATRPKPTVHLG